MKKLFISMCFIVIFITLCVTVCFADAQIHMQNKELQLTDQDIKNALDKIPKVFTKDLNIYVLDKQYAPRVLGTYWGEGKIEIYNNPGIEEGELIKINTSSGEIIKEFYIKDEIDHIISHEIGHHIQVMIKDTYYYKLYERVTDMNIRVHDELHEDFAMSFSEYIVNTKQFKKYCPNKYVFFQFLTHEMELKIAENKRNFPEMRIGKAWSWNAIRKD
jgi:hypothetical protein